MIDRVSVIHGDSREVLKGFPDGHFDSVVTDPPYALVSITKRFGKAAAGDNTQTSERVRNRADGYARAASGFMGQQWDTGETAFDPEFWAEVLRVLKPGGHIVAFSGTRTYHRMTCAIEDAGFEIRDCLQWIYGSGFPKSHDVSKAIDRHLGCERKKVRVEAADVRNPKAPGAGRDGTDGASRPWIESAMARGFHEAVSDEAVSDEAVSWHGWGTAFKPAVEPICLARKPLNGTVAANVLEYGTGGINVDACRVQFAGMEDAAAAAAAVGFAQSRARGTVAQSQSIGKESRDGTNRYDPFALAGRWPANVIHDGSAEVVALFPDSDGQQAKVTGNEPTANGFSGDVKFGGMRARVGSAEPRGDSGSASRFFYTAKADADDRMGSKHPTVKPIDLMQWLVRLVTPPGGLVLDPFAGSGTTGEAAFREGMRCVLIEREANFVADIRRRVELLLAGPEERNRETIKQKIADGRIIDDPGPLFGGTEIAQAGRQAGRQIYGHFADQDERLARRGSSGE